MARYGHEERDAIHVHDICAERDFLISLVDGGWQWGVGEVGGNRMGAASDSFAFEAAKIGTENIFRGHDVTLGNRAVGQKVVVDDMDEITRGGTANFS